MRILKVFLVMIVKVSESKQKKIIGSLYYIPISHLIHIKMTFKTNYPDLNKYVPF